jgi:hypothetical protein
MKKGQKLARLLATMDAQNGKVEQQKHFDAR